MLNQKSNETQYSKKDIDKELSINDLKLEIPNFTDNIAENDNTTSNNSGKMNCDLIDNSIHQINNISTNLENEVINNERLKTYRNYLSNLKINFKDSYKNILIKETII